MLSSIHPLGEEGRGNAYWVTATAFVSGSVLGGAVTGLTTGVAGWVLAGLSTSPALWVDARPLLLVAVVTAAWVARRTGSLPGLARQVNENWLSAYRGWVYGFGFGFQLGSGLATYVRSAAVWVWVAAMVLLASPVVAVGLGALFGLLRGASILTTRSIRSPHQLMAFHRRLHQPRPVRAAVWGRA